MNLRFNTLRLTTLRSQNFGEQGQALTFLIVLLPVLLIVAGIIVRSGKTLLAHQRAINHCDKKILDALEPQGNGLQALGTLNPVARSIIDARRIVDDILKVAIIYPPLIPELVEAQKILKGLQKVVAAQQTLITTTSVFRSFAVMREPVPKEDQGKLSEVFSPDKPEFPHAVKSSMRLHVEKESDYKSETGSPLQLDSDFNKRQKLRAEMTMQTEKYLDLWRDFGLRQNTKAASNMRVICEAQINMKSLEDKWSAQLIQPEVKPSLRSLLE